MATEAYIQPEVTFAGRVLGEVFAVTLYDPDSDDARGSLTTHQPLKEGERGELIIVGLHAKKRWKVTLPEVEVSRSSAVGCEFTIFGRIMREELPS
jgi:hypothetical protein